MKNFSNFGLLLVLLVLLILPPISGHTSDNAGSLLAICNPHSIREINPAQIFSRTGLDPSQFSMKWVHDNMATFDYEQDHTRRNLLPRSLQSFFEPNNTTLALFYKNIKIGSIDIVPGPTSSELRYYDTRSVIINIDSVDALPTKDIDIENKSINFIGKGVGLLFYITAASYVYKHSRYLIYRSSTTTKNSRSLWTRLVEQGFAEELINPFNQKVIAVRFRRDALQREDIQRLPEYFSLD